MTTKHENIVMSSMSINTDIINTGIINTDTINTDTINLTLVSIGFRVYYWYPSKYRTLPPISPKDVFQHPYRNGFIYTNQNNPDISNLGKLLGYIHSYPNETGWGKNTLWISWFLEVSDGTQIHMWSEAIPDTSDSWNCVRTRLCEIKDAIYTTELKDYKVSIKISTNPTTGNPY